KLRSEDGTIRSYTVRELSGKERDEYLTETSKRFRTDQSGKAIGVRDFDGLQSSLLVRCMTDDETNKLVTVNFLAGLPARIQEDLYERARKISKLNKEAKAEAKND